MGPLLTLFSKPPADPPFDSTSQKLFLSSFRRLWLFPDHNAFALHIPNALFLPPLAGMADKPPSWGWCATWDAHCIHSVLSPIALEWAIQVQTLKDPECWHNTADNEISKAQLLVSPRKQKIAVNKFWAQESDIGEECLQFWTWILAWIFWVAWNPGKTRPKNSLSKFAEKFAGNFPNFRRTKIKNSP